MPRRVARPIEVGETFGEWTVIETGHYIQHKIQRNRAALCRCSCDVEKLVQVSNLHRGMSRSCGAGIHDVRKNLKPRPPKPKAVSVALKTSVRVQSPEVPELEVCTTVTVVLKVARANLPRPVKLPGPVTVRLKTARANPEPKPDRLTKADDFYQGVHRLLNGKFQARTVIDGKRRQLGTFDTQNEAEAAYADALRSCLIPAVVSV